MLQDATDSVPEPVIIQFHKLGQVVELDVDVSEGAHQALFDVSGDIDVVPKGDSLLLGQGVPSFCILVPWACTRFEKLLHPSL